MMGIRTIVAACLVLGACAAGPGLPLDTADRPLPDEEQLASDLAAAALAFDEGDLEGLRNAVIAIESSAGTPADEPSRALLAQWRNGIDGLPISRGRTLGPGFRSGVLPPGRALSLEQSFLAGEAARIALSTPDSRPIELRVTNGEKTICVKTAERSSCRWVPIFSARYSIALRNGSNRRVRYLLGID